MIKKIWNFVKDNMKRNFKIEEYVERLSAVMIGAVTFFAFSIGGWEIGVPMLIVGLIDPRWFKD